LAALCNLGAAAAPEWGLLLTARALEGLALGGVPGTAMAYLAAEAPPERLGLAMGLNVAGAAFGGMTGRVAMGALAELTSWRVAIAALSLGDLIAATVFIALLPRARSEPPREAAPLAGHLGAWLGHLRDRTLLRLYLTAFLAMGAFVAAYNYIGFRLLAPPYRLNQGQVGLIFLSYLLGMAASSWGGALADRFGRRPMILAGAVAAIAGEALTLASPLFWVIVGVAVLTAGFFVVHSVASGWVGARALANRSHASSLYLLAYYAGASLLGWSGGWLWRSRGWPGLVAGCAAAMLAVLGLAASIGASEPAPTPRRDHGSAA